MRRGHLALAVLASLASLAALTALLAMAAGTGTGTGTNMGTRTGTGTRMSVVAEVGAAAGAEPAAEADTQRLRLRALQIPVLSVVAADLQDTYLQARGGGTRPHEALDIPAHRGTPVLAVEDGRIAKLFLSQPGGLTVYHFDPGGEFAYYYAHLDRYADGLAEGMRVQKGQVIGYVGSTGNAAPEAPHLHFAIFRLGPERQWWRGSPVNPFGVWAVHR